MWSAVLNCSQEETAQSAVSEKKKQKEHKRQQEVEKREQKERLKKENEYRKRFKVSCFFKMSIKLYTLSIMFLLSCEKCTFLIFVAMRYIIKMWIFFYFTITETHFNVAQTWLVLRAFIYLLSLHISYRCNANDFKYELKHIFIEFILFIKMTYYVYIIWSYLCGRRNPFICVY